MKAQGIRIIKTTRLKRLIAFVIDILILEFIFIPFNPLIKKVFQRGFEFDIIVDGNTSIIYLLIAMGAIALLYFSIFEYKLRQSIGKMFMNIYVISAYKEIRIWQVIVRNLLFIPIFPFNLLSIIDLIFFIVKNRRFSEIITKTDTVEAIARW